MKFAVITGASSGIGLATARAFLQNGYQVINLSRRVCPDSGVENCCGDLTLTSRDLNFMRSLRARVSKAGSLCLIHNACQHTNDTVGNTGDADFAKALDLNLRVPNLLNQALLEDMAPGSSILYVGSTLSEKAVAGAFSYVISKHALVGMMKASVQDLSGRSIHSACICPGFTDTEMLRNHLDNDAQKLQQIALGTAFRRIAKPEEIANLLLFVANNPALNGSVIHANLGQLET